MLKAKPIIVLFILLILVPCGGIHASPLGIAGEYNVFMFGNIFQWDTDVEGRVAAGGDVVYGLPDAGNGFSVASKVEETRGLADLVAGGSVTLTNGSVGYFGQENSGGSDPVTGRKYQDGTIAYGRSASIAETVGYGRAYQGNPIDFKVQQSYLQGMSAFWGGLSSAGMIVKPWDGQVYLVGSDPALNVFNLDSSYFTQNLGFFLNVPQTSTILLNISDADADKRIRLTDIGFYMSREFMAADYIARNDEQAMLKYLSGKDALYPHANILFNFLDAENLFIDRIEINGSILAPWADVIFEKESHIDGNLIANNLFGRGESHTILFNGRLPVHPVPEPATILLIAGGLLGLAVCKRRSKDLS
ncbi:MAG: choice-of-anchor A family protein [Desulfobacterales bacterium]|jgi:choice-of-anchor A domain-containing protein|nr:choice-of-anchor A family protein [Desulfobacterales bacterium]